MLVTAPVTKGETNYLFDHPSFSLGASRLFRRFSLSPLVEPTLKNYCNLNHYDSIGWFLTSMRGIRVRQIGHIEILLLINSLKFIPYAWIITIQVLTVSYI